MPLESGRKPKLALNILISVFFVCLLSKTRVVDGKSILKVENYITILWSDPTKIEAAKTGPDNSSNFVTDELPFLSHLPQRTAENNTEEVVNDNHDQMNNTNSIPLANPAVNADRNLMKLSRFKRAPYPPGYVAWNWRKPCFCPPGQYFSCRCYFNSSSASSEENKLRKRRSRGKKFKY